MCVNTYGGYRCRCLPEFENLCGPSTGGELKNNYKQIHYWSRRFKHVCSYCVSLRIVLMTLYILLPQSYKVYSWHNRLLSCVFHGSEGVNSTWQHCWNQDIQQLWKNSCWFGLEPVTLLSMQKDLTFRAAGSFWVRAQLSTTCRWRKSCASTATCHCYLLCRSM